MRPYDLSSRIRKMHIAWSIPFRKPINLYWNRGQHFKKQRFYCDSWQVWIQRTLLYVPMSAETSYCYQTTPKANSFIVSLPGNDLVMVQDWWFISNAEELMTVLRRVPRLRLSERSSFSFLFSPLSLLACFRVWLSNKDMKYRKWCVNLCKGCTHCWFRVWHKGSGYLDFMRWCNYDDKSMCV